MSLDLLRTRIVEAETDLDPRQVDALIAALQGDQPIMEAGLHWARQGSWPDEPALETWTPSRIGEFLPPFSVLRALIGLREDPQAWLRTLGEMYMKTHPRGERSTDPFHDGWPFDQDPDPDRPDDPGRPAT
jgi:hypothetical protein